MFPKINPTSTVAWQRLQHKFEATNDKPIKDLFQEDEKRFDKFSLQFEEILFDYSKNGIDGETLKLLFELAEQCRLEDAMKAMFSAEKINGSEDRAVLHTALRNFSENPVMLDGKDVMKEVKKVQEQMKTFCNKVHDGSWKGFSGKKNKIHCQYRHRRQ